MRLQQTFKKEMTNECENSKHKRCCSQYRDLAIGCKITSWISGGAHGFPLLRNVQIGSKAQSKSLHRPAKLQTCQTIYRWTMQEKS